MGDNMNNIIDSLSPQSAIALDHAEQLIKEFERGPNGSFAARPYLCPAGKRTIGWGHVILSDDAIQYPITENQANYILRQDILRIADRIEHAIRVHTTLSMKAALISFTFNVGVYAFRNSTLLRLLNSGDYRGAADQFDRWNKVTDPRTGLKIILPGLTRRRSMEKELFLRDGLPNEF